MAFAVLRTAVLRVTGGLVAGTGSLSLYQYYKIRTTYKPLPKPQISRYGIETPLDPTVSFARKRMTEIGVDGGPTPSTPRADGGDIIFVGDSLVMGVGCSKDTTRPVFSRRIARRVATALQKRMSWSVYGINGADARRMQTLISGMESDIKTRRESGQTAGVRAVVVMCGLNDYKNLVTEGRLPSDFKRDLRRLVDGIHAAVGAEVPVFLPVLPVEQAPAFKDLFPFNVCLAAVASAWDRQKGFLSDEMDHVVFVDSPSTFHSEDWAVDGIHPSEKGYIEWADHIANRMLPVAAVSEVC